MKDTDKKNRRGWLSRLFRSKARAATPATHSRGKRAMVRRAVQKGNYCFGFSEIAKKFKGRAKYRRRTNNLATMTMTNGRKIRP